MKIFFSPRLSPILAVLLWVFGCASLSAQVFLEKKDPYTGETAVYEQTKVFADGTPMTKAKADGVMYLVKDNDFYRRRIENHINVKWFGVKGDGDKNDLGTDDTKALENAVKILSQIYKGYDLSGDNLYGGFTLYFPAGKYIVSKTLVLPSNISVLGASPYTTVIHAKKPGFIFTNIAGFKPNGVDVIMNHNITIRNLTLKQGGIEFQQAVSSRIEHVRILNLFGKGTDTGISIKLSVDLRISDVKIFSSTGYGILFQESVGGKASTTTSFDKVWVAHCRVGMLIDGSDGSYGIVSSNISNSIFEYNTTGIQIAGKVANFSLRDLHFEQNTENALAITGDVNLVLENIWGDKVGAMNISQTGRQSGQNVIYLRNFNIPYKVNTAFKGKIVSD